MILISKKNMETIYWTCGGVANMVNIINVRLNSFFLGSHNSQEVTLPRKSQFLGSNIFWEVAFLGNWQTNATHAFQQDPGRSHLLGSQISWEVTFQKKITFPSKSNFLKNKIIQEVTFPEKLHSQKIIFRKLTFPGKSHFPVSYISQEVTYPWIHILSRNSLLPRNLLLPGILHFPRR